MPLFSPFRQRHLPPFSRLRHAAIDLPHYAAAMMLTLFSPFSLYASAISRVFALAYAITLLLPLFSFSFDMLRY
jgi:hypothetical protein